MENIEIYEYAIIHKHCQIVQYRGIGKKVSNELYNVEFFNNEKSMGNRYIKLDELETVRSFRILSLNNDYEHYKQLLLNSYNEMIEREQQKIQKQLNFLQKLELNTTKQ